MIIMDSFLGQHNPSNYFALTKEMRSLVQEMIHFRKGFQPTQEPDLKKVSEFEKRYQKILETARKEYRDIPQMIIIETGIIYF